MHHTPWTCGELTRTESLKDLSVEQIAELWDPGSPPCAGLPKVAPSVAPANLFNPYHRLPPYTAIVGDLGVCLDLRQ